MQTTTEIKKGKGIDGLLRGITPGNLETERKVEVVGENNFSELLNFYGMALTAGRPPAALYEILEINNIQTVLDPASINAVLQATVQYEACQYYPSQTSSVVNELIRRSYAAGNQKFILNTRGLPDMPGLASLLVSVKERQIMLDVYGNVGPLFGKKSLFSVLNVHGVAGDKLGWAARNTEFSVTEGLGEQSGFYARDCTFKTPNEEVLEKFVESVAPVMYCKFNDFLEETNIPSRNRIIFINSDRTEEVVKDYAGNQ